MADDTRLDAGENGPQAPAGGELEVLGVLWQAEADGAQALRLSEVRDLLHARHGRAPEPSTVSSQLRKLFRRGLIEEVGISLGLPAVSRVRGVVETRAAVRGGGHSVPTRSPFTAYRPKLSPGEALRPLLQQLVNAYPAAARTRVLVDVARVLGLAAETIVAIERLVSPGPVAFPAAGTG